MLRANEFKGTSEGLEKNASTWMASEEAFIDSNHILDLPSVITLRRSSTHTKPLGDEKDIMLNRNGKREKSIND